MRACEVEHWRRWEIRKRQKKKGKIIEWAVEFERGFGIQVKGLSGGG